MSKRTQSGHSSSHNSETAKQTINEAQDQAKATAFQMKNEVGEQVEKAKSALVDQVEHQKDRASGSLNQTADALNEAAGNLNADSVPRQLLSGAASGLRSVSEQMEGKNVGEIADGLSGFARRNPAAFLGGAVLAGFAIARFARASRPSNEGSDTSQTQAPASMRQTEARSVKSPGSATNFSTPGAS